MMYHCFSRHQTKSLIFIAFYGTGRADWHVVVTSCRLFTGFTGTYNQNTSLPRPRISRWLAGRRLSRRQGFRRHFDRLRRRMWCPVPGREQTCIVFASFLLQITFHAEEGSGSRPFKPCGAGTAPFPVARGDELVDNHSVRYEVTELFPEAGVRGGEQSG